MTKSTYPQFSHLKSRQSKLSSGCGWRWWKATLGRTSAAASGQGAHFSLPATGTVMRVFVVVVVVPEAADFILVKLFVSFFFLFVVVDSGSESATLELLDRRWNKVLNFIFKFCPHFPLVSKPTKLRSLLKTEKSQL